VKRVVALFVLLFAVWLVWSGHYSPFLIAMGVLSSLLVAVIAHRMGVADEEGVPLEISLRALAYLPYLLLEIVKANIDVTRRILSPRLPIGPRIFRTRALQKSDLGRTIYANSITLTPGTVSIGVEEDEITVHALAREAEEGVLTDEMNRRVTRVEGRR